MTATTEPTYDFIRTTHLSGTVQHKLVQRTDPAGRRAYAIITQDDHQYQYRAGSWYAPMTDAGIEYVVGGGWWTSRATALRHWRALIKCCE